MPPNTRTNNFFMVASHPLWAKVYLKPFVVLKAEPRRNVRIGSETDIRQGFAERRGWRAHEGTTPRKEPNDAARAAPLAVVSPSDCGGVGEMSGTAGHYLICINVQPLALCNFVKSREKTMRGIGLTLTAAVALIASGVLADRLQAAPIAPSEGLRAALGSLDVVEKAQVLVWHGRRYCWYDDGWQGPGFYWCGYAWREGLGWGGGSGWNGWQHGRERQGRQQRGRQQQGISQQGGQKQGGEKQGGQKQQGFSQKGGQKQGGEKQGGQK